MTGAFLVTPTGLEPFGAVFFLGLAVEVAPTPVSTAGRIRGASLPVAERVEAILSKDCAGV